MRRLGGWVTDLLTRGRRSDLFSWLNPKSLKGRLLITAGLWMALVLSVGGLVLSGTFQNYLESEFDQKLARTLDSMVGASELSPDGFVRFTRALSDQRFVEPYSGWYWQISTTGQRAFRSRSLWDQELPIDPNKAALFPRIYVTSGPDDQNLRIIWQDIQLQGSEQVFRYLVAGDMAEITNQMGNFNKLLLYSLSALGAGLLAALFLQVTVGLLPLRKIRRALSDIRTGKATRLNQPFPPEIQPLANEMNEVLDHNDHVVERARTHVGNLAHALKTPISILQNEIQKGGGEDYLDLVERQIEVMQSHVEHHLRRAQLLGRARVIGKSASLDKAIREVSNAIEGIFQEKNLKISFDLTVNLKFAGLKQDLDELLGNLLDNAAKWAKSSIHIKTTITQGSHNLEKDVHYFNLIIEDDGPGVDKEKRSKLFERGLRLDEKTPGSGLGLAIVKDIVELYGGEVDMDEAEMGGLKVSLILPLINDKT